MIQNNSKSIIVSKGCLICYFAVVLPAYNISNTKNVFYEMLKNRKSLIDLFILNKPKTIFLFFFAHLLILNDLNTCRQTKCNRIMTQRCYCYFLCLVHNMSILDRWKWRLLDRKLIIIFIPFFDGHALLFSFIIMLLTN